MKDKNSKKRDHPRCHSGWTLMLRGLEGWRRDEVLRVLLPSILSLDRCLESVLLEPPNQRLLSASSIVLECFIGCFRSNQIQWKSTEFHGVDIGITSNATGLEGLLMLTVDAFGYCFVSDYKSRLVMVE